MDTQNPALVVTAVLGGVLVINLIILAMLRGGRKIDFFYYRTLYNTLRDARQPLKKQYDDMDELSRRVKELKSGESRPEDTS